MDKQIEEMAKVIEEAMTKARRTLGGHNNIAMFYAKMLVNAGYRKIPENAANEQKLCVYEKKSELDFVWWECSECGSGFNFCADTPYHNRFHYCPYCGATIIACEEDIQNGRNEI